MVKIVDLLQDSFEYDLFSQCTTREIHFGLSVQDND